jgi:hypothetical protein
VAAVTSAQAPRPGRDICHEGLLKQFACTMGASVTV